MPLLARLSVCNSPPPEGSSSAFTPSSRSLLQSKYRSMILELSHRSMPKHFAPNSVMPLAPRYMRSRQLWPATPLHNSSIPSSPSMVLFKSRVRKSSLDLKAAARCSAPVAPIGFRFSQRLRTFFELPTAAANLAMPSVRMALQPTNTVSNGSRSLIISASASAPSSPSPSIPSSKCFTGPSAGIASATARQCNGPKACLHKSSRPSGHTVPRGKLSSCSGVVVAVRNHFSSGSSSSVGQGVTQPTWTTGQRGRGASGTASTSCFPA
mmetsp:Transcript_11940/g.21859  ORF Transcript_11940/g.21859 Transcript_11940/m.21859 type:complete len:267 (+) Transcript_11940:1174-1974(+)